MKSLVHSVLYIVFIFTCFLLPELSAGQQPFTRKISFLEGLTSDVVYDLFVDKGGLLYLGTDKGLMTYNGVHFKQVEMPNSFGNSVNSIQQDYKGKIWCKNFANQLFYLQNDKLIVDEKVNSLLNLMDANLIDYRVGKEKMYLLTQEGIYTYTQSKIKRIFNIDKKGFEIFNSIVYDSKNDRLYVSSNRSIYTFKNDVLIETKSTPADQKILEIYNGSLVYCTRSLDKNCVVGDKIIPLYNTQLSKTFLNQFSSTKDDLWLCTNKGIYQFDEKNNNFKDGFLKESRITDIVQDLEGNHWISSLDEGLFMLPNRNLYQLQMPFDEKRSFTKVSKGPNENYFVGTNDGNIIEITGQGKLIREYQTHWDNNIEFINFAGDTILTNYGFFKIGNPKIFSNNVYFGKNLVEDDEGNFLIAFSSFGGLISRNLKGLPKFDNKKGTFRTLNYGTDYINTVVLRSKRSKSALYHAARQEYYFGFVDGLFIYDKAGNESELKTDKNESIVASQMLLNDDGSIWIATVQKGVYLVKDKKIINHLSTTNGLSDNNCRQIAKGSNGIWIVTESGFDFYAYSSKRVQNAELNLCIKGITINDLTTINNTVALATNKGIFYFNKKILDQDIVPAFSFTKFLVNNKEHDYSKQLILKHNQNNININFNTIHYKSLGNYTYRYRLKGLDDKWFVSHSDAKNINFLALTPGTYKFQIHIKIGEKYTPIQEINFKIEEPFWFQYWFLTIIMLTILAMLYFVYRWTEHKTRRRQEYREQLAISQLTALRSQMNPHFIFNVLNAVQGLIYSNQKNKASDYLGKFSDLMRRILETSDKNEVTIEKEFETIDLYISLEKARFEEDFEYFITFPDDVDLSDYKIPSMIIQPFVENAIKHGLMHKAGLKILDIKVELLEDMWCFTVDDNGIGRKASEKINQKIKKHISFATKAIDNRIILMNKITATAIDIEIIDKKSIDGESLGTRIKIYIPNSDK